MDINLELKSNSRFKYGRRRSRSLGGIISTELCKTIDISLPLEERLKLLVEYSLKNSFRIAEREFNFSVSSDEFNKRVSECLTKIDSEVSEKDLYKACSFEKVTLAEQKLADNLASYNEEAARIDKESEEWDNLLANERMALDSTKDEVKTYAFQGTLDTKEYEKLNYTNLANDISLSFVRKNRKLNKMSSSYKKISKYVELTNKVTARLNKEAVDSLSTKVKATPRTLIKRLKRS